MLSLLQPLWLHCSYLQNTRLHIPAYTPTHTCSVGIGLRPDTPVTTVSCCMSHTTVSIFLHCLWSDTIENLYLVPGSDGSYVLICQNSVSQHCYSPMETLLNPSHQFYPPVPWTQVGVPVSHIYWTSLTLEEAPSCLFLDQN